MGGQMKISTATAKGTRPYQEDKYFTLHTKEGLYLHTKEGLYLGVFDGHGGAECSAFCADVFPSILQRKPVLQDALEELNVETRSMHSGSTASVVFLPKGNTKAHVAVLGDSPVIIKRVDGSIWIAPEHNVRTNKVEAEAAKARGGFVSGGYLFAHYDGSGLQMSRALGDAALDGILLRTPEIFEHELGENSFVLVATDGAVDPAHSSGSYGTAPTSPIDDLIHAIERGTTAEQIVNNALAVPTRDNVTALLVEV
jgi:serine/threonine protein phosphatase PrpC